MDSMANPLDALRDIHTPPPIGWWPLAPGWWILAALIIIAIAAIVYWYKRRPKKKVIVDYRQTTLSELEKIANTEQDDAFIQELTVLMKRYVHAYQPNAAALTGKAWIDFLDQTGGQGQFQTYHHQLCVAPYQPGKTEQKDELIKLVKNWISAFHLHANNMERN